MNHALVTGREGENRAVSYAKRTAIWIPVAVVASLALPMLLTDRSFGSDWTLHLWLLRQQQWNIAATGHPGLFVSAKPLGAFYPIMAFVGSGIYSTGAYLAIVLGDRPIAAYKLLYLSGLCMAYGGLTWLSVQRGLRGWHSQVAGLVFVTEAYVVTDLAGRGDLGEFMALASIPLLLAAIYAVLTVPTTALPLRVRDLVALIVATFVFTGSHNVTLLWGTLFIALLGLVLMIAYWRPRPRPLPWKRLGALIGCAAIGAGLNAWYLFPDLAYGLDTHVALVSRGHLPAVVHNFAFMLNPLRLGYSDVYPDVRMSMPWLFIAWALVVALAFRRGRDGAAKRLFIGIVAIMVGHVLLIISSRPWRLLPHVLFNVQFSWRLGAYVVLATAILVLLALEWQSSASGTPRRAASATLAIMLAFNVGIATWQVWRVQPDYVHNGRVVATNNSFAETVVASRTAMPPSWRDVVSFRDGTSPLVPHRPGRVLNVPLTEVHGSSYAGILAVPDGPEPFYTNISAGPQFIRTTGIRPVGRTTQGFIVAVRSRDVPSVGRIEVTIHEADSMVLRAGATVSVISALALLMLLASPLRRFAPTRGRRA